MENELLQAILDQLGILTERVDRLAIGLDEVTEELVSLRGAVENDQGWYQE